MATWDTAEQFTGPRNHMIEGGYDVVITSAKDGRAWHQIDQPQDQDISWQQAFLKVGAFHPTKVRLTLPNGQPSEAYSVVRTDPKNPGEDPDNPNLIELGPGVTEDYTIFDNEKLFRLAEPYLESEQAYITAAGSLRKGKDLFCCLRVKQEYMLDGGSNDAIRPFLLFRNSHDAKRGIRLTFSGIRTVCNNTVVSAEAQGIGLTIRHTGNVDANVAEAVKTIDIANQRLAATAEQYALLKTIQVDQVELEKYVVRVLSTEKIEDGFGQIIRDSELTPEQAKQKAEEFEKALFPQLKAKVLANFEEAPGCDGESLLGALSAVTYWTTHQRGNDEVNRFRSLYFGGDSNRVNGRALRVALEIAKSKG